VETNNVTWMSSTYQFPSDANERGFYPEKDEKGKTTGRLIDSGNWRKRRNKRFKAIANGLITAHSGD
jgi:hypothetical protein